MEDFFWPLFFHDKRSFSTNRKRYNICHFEDISFLVFTNYYAVCSGHLAKQIIFYTKLDLHKVLQSNVSVKLCGKDRSKRDGGVLVRDWKKRLGIRHFRFFDAINYFFVFHQESIDKFIILLLLLFLLDFVHVY